MQDTCTHHFEPQRFDRVSSGGQGRSKYGQKLPHIAPYCSVFWPSLTPTVNPVKSLLFKMVCTCVPHIVLHVLSSTSTSGGYFRPQKSILAKIAIFGCFWDFKCFKGSWRKIGSTELLRLRALLGRCDRVDLISCPHLSPVQCRKEKCGWLSGIF